ncbi:MAG: peptidylprolyl isomerase [Bacteroidales bacterium]|nr:peptidylprolyl isomerase [Bacteroidales bacterium]
MKRTHFLRGLALLATGLFVMAASAQSKLDKQVLMTIGGQPVTVKEFSDVYSKNNLSSDAIDKKSVDDYLDLFVNFRMKVMEAHEMGLDTTAKFKRELDGYRKQLAKPYFTNDEVSEELVEEAYQRKLKDIRASHILIRCDKHALPVDTLKAYNKAMDIRKKAMKGEDFGRLAVLYSEDPSARDIAATETTPGRPGNKGDLGFFTVFDMVYPFETGAYNTKEGEISMPVRSDFGYHLIKVNSVTDALGSIDAAHIFLKLAPNASESEVAEAKAKADNIYKELKEEDGKNWKEAVRKYSEDRATSHQGGQLSTFTVNRIVPEFIEAVKQLQPNEISQPVRTNYGFHIIKLIDKTGVDTFEKEKRGLAERVEKDMRSKKTEEVVLQQIKDEYGFKQNDKHLLAFMSTIDSSLLKASYELSPDADKDANLFTIGKQGFSVGDFAQYIVAKQKRQQYVTPQTYVYQLYESFQKEKIMDYADQHLEERYPEFKTLIREYNDGILLFDLMEKQVWNKAVEDTAGLKAFHARHVNDYQWKDRVEACIITVNKLESLPMVRQYLNEGVPFDSLRSVLDRDSVRYVNVYSGKFQHGDNRFVDEVEWKPGLRKEIPSTVDYSVTIVNIISFLPAGPKTLQEAKGLVTSDYQLELEKQWMKDLHKKYPVKINEKVLEKVRKRYQ